MKVDRKALAVGLVIIAAVPLLMLRQSNNPSTGTSPRKSKYHIDHFVSILNEYLCKKRQPPPADETQPSALEMFCDFVLDRDRNGAYTAVWIDHVASLRGDCADVRIARGRLCAAMGDREGMRREFAAARTLAGDDLERRHVEYVLRRFGE